MDRKWICELLPELAQVRDEALRNLTADAILAAIQQGGWNEESIHRVPVTLNWRGCQCNLIEHIRAVTRMCIDSYPTAARLFEQNGVPFERDVVVSGALLHDIGKFTEFALRDGKIVRGENADYLRHPLAGAILAWNAGLPPKLIHLIAVHSFEGERSYQSPESSFVRTVDDLIFKCTVFGLQK